MNPDVLVLTEHGLNKNKLKETRLDDYVLMESFSRENHLKGGTANYVREDLAGSTSNLNIADWSTELICEVAGIKITIDKTDYHIIGVYRPEGDFTTAVDTLSNVLEEIPTWKSPIHDYELKLKGDSFLKAKETYTLTGSEQNKIDANIKKKEYDHHLKNVRKQRAADFIKDSDNKSKAMWKLINKERSNNSCGNEL
ncbi:hypothetical protein J6590_038652 [Homalodisca vitripennis]|nr:hypothetical protein J6590_038652 [Homalodisca vitripennis]